MYPPIDFPLVWRCTFKFLFFQLRHPNVVKYHKAFQESEWPCVELCFLSLFGAVFNWVSQNLACSRFATDPARCGPRFPVRTNRETGTGYVKPSADYRHYLQIAAFPSLHQTKPEVITLANHKWHTGNPVNQSKLKANTTSKSAGKRIRASHDWFWFFPWRDTKLQNQLKANRVVNVAIKLQSYRRIEMQEFTNKYNVFDWRKLFDNSFKSSTVFLLKYTYTNHFLSFLFCHRGQTVRCNGINRRSSSRRTFQFLEGKGNKIFWRESMAYFYTGMLIQAFMFYKLPPTNRISRSFVSFVGLFV